MAEYDYINPVIGSGCEINQNIDNIESRLLYFSPNSIPELKVFDKKERYKIWRYCYERYAPSHFLCYISCFFKAVIFLGSPILVLHLARDEKYQEILSNELLQVFIGSAIGCLFGELVQININVRVLRKDLQKTIKQYIEKKRAKS